MANVKAKPIHLIVFRVHYGAYAICDNYLEVVPIEAAIKRYVRYNDPKGTFNPKKVTCKRCLKHPDYKKAMDREKYPLLFWKERI